MFPALHSVYRLHALPLHRLLSNTQDNPLSFYLRAKRIFLIWAKFFSPKIYSKRPCIFMVQGLFLSFRLSSTRINKGFYPLLRKITINRRAPFTSRAWIIFIAPTEIILFALRYLSSYKQTPARIRFRMRAGVSFFPAKKSARSKKNR